MKKNHESYFLNEFYSLIHLDHPNIVRVNEVYEEEDCFKMVMNYCSYGDLGRYIK